MIKDGNFPWDFSLNSWRECWTDISTDLSGWRCWLDWRRRGRWRWPDSLPGGRGASWTLRGELRLRILSWLTLQPRRVVCRQRSRAWVCQRGRSCCEAGPASPWGCPPAPPPAGLCPATSSGRGWPPASAWTGGARRLEGRGRGRRAGAGTGSRGRRRGHCGLWAGQSRRGRQLPVKTDHLQICQVSLAVLYRTGDGKRGRKTLKYLTNDSCWHLKYFLGAN